MGGQRPLVDEKKGPAHTKALCHPSSLSALWFPSLCFLLPQFAKSSQFSLCPVVSWPVSILKIFLNFEVENVANSIEGFYKSATPTTEYVYLRKSLRETHSCFVYINSLRVF